MSVRKTIVDRLKRTYGDVTICPGMSGDAARIILNKEHEGHGCTIWLQDDSVSMWVAYNQYFRIAYADPDFFAKLDKMITTGEL